jgi:hypothetical protein
MLDAGFIEEVHHPVWLANPVIVPKANGKLWMCIDYTSLNKACPKDPYPLPRIDQIMDSTSGCDHLSFLDAYSGFHQIQMSRECFYNNGCALLLCRNALRSEKRLADICAGDE